MIFNSSFNPIKKLLIQKINTYLLESLDLQNIEYIVDIPEHQVHGDISTNVALVLAKVLKKDPLDLSSRILNFLNKDVSFTNYFKRIDIVKPGFINFFVDSNIFQNFVNTFFLQIHASLDILKDKVFLIEHTSPNPNKA
ncbi:MAG: hypothetical protein NZZ41_05740, partial [Candidatus Dojkabacteria bacterium]|nr:hypothetical protein [Candidatus Dojkabacteria bacterium]